jgi:hypothetical protein
MDGRGLPLVGFGVRILTHIQKLDDAFGLFLVHITCRRCRAVRVVKPQFLADIVGWQMSLKDLEGRMLCSKCQAKDAEVVAVPEPRPRGWSQYPR